MQRLVFVELTYYSVSVLRTDTWWDSAGVQHKAEDEFIRSPVAWGRRFAVPLDTSYFIEVEPGYLGVNGP
jgi:hypothetical protein